MSTKTDILTLANLLQLQSDKLHQPLPIEPGWLADHLSLEILVALKLQPTPRLFEAFIGLTALYTHQPQLVTGQHFAAAAEALISTETQSGGPYLDTAFTDIALTTNAAISLFMRKIGTPLPRVDAYLQQAVEHASRGHLMLETETLSYLSLATETLSSDDRPQSTTPRVFPLTLGQQANYERITADCITHVNDAPRLLHAPLQVALQSVQHADSTYEISLLATMFIESLLPSHVPSQGFSALCRSYGVANTFCWMAYTAYDNILDKEFAAEIHLPVANLAHRLAYGLYRAGSSHLTNQLIDQIFNDMDTANFWELQHSRANIRNDSITLNTLPEYSDHAILAERSGGHILGPLLLACHIGYTPYSPSFQALHQGLRHYLIARQLQDDLHDWSDDLAQGQLNAVTTDLLQQLHIRPDVYSIKRLLAHLKQAFWEGGLLRQCAIITSHTQAARLALQRCEFLIPKDSPLLSLVDRLEHAAQEAEHNYYQYKDFIKYYS